MHMPAVRTVHASGGVHTSYYLNAVEVVLANTEKLTMRVVGEEFVVLYEDSRREMSECLFSYPLSADQQEQEQEQEQS